MNSLQGQLLIARPELHDENFFRSVVLLVEHNREITLGLTLNRPGEMRVDQLWRQVAEVDVECEDPVYLGGPVAGPLMLLHSSPSCSESEICTNVHLATQRDPLLEVIGENRTPFRLFSGYAGWSEGQLEGELSRGDWITLPGSFELVFRVLPEELWRVAISAWGEGVYSQLGIREVPKEPWLN